jgi:hypothetical protein
MDQFKNRTYLEDELEGGKYAGLKVREVLEEDPEYIIWMMNQGDEMHPLIIDELTKIGLISA